MAAADVGLEADGADQGERSWSIAFSPPKGAPPRAPAEGAAEAPAARLRVQQFAEVRLAVESAAGAAPSGRARPALL